MRILLLVIFLTALVQADPLATRTLPESGISVDIYLTSVNDQKETRWREFPAPKGVLQWSLSSRTR